MKKIVFMVLTLISFQSIIASEIVYGQCDNKQKFRFVFGSFDKEGTGSGILYYKNKKYKVKSAYAGSGMRYTGDNIQFWIHSYEASISKFPNNKDPNDGDAIYEFRRTSCKISNTH